MNNANFGIGKLEAVVATGIKQKDITDKHNLETYLKLDEILVPLKSAYTSTPDDIKSEETVEEEVPVEEEEVSDDT